MALLINVETFKDTLITKVKDKNTLILILESLNMYYDNYGIFYYINDNKYITSDIHKYVHKILSQHNISKKIIPKIIQENVAITVRYIIENGKEIEYEKSEYLLNKINKYGKHKPLSEEEKQERKRLRVITQKKSELHRKNNKSKSFARNIENFKNELLKEQNILAFDLEFWEKDTSQVLEIGFSFFNTNTRTFVNKNLVILDNLDKVNGQYVPNNKYNFLHGETLFLKEKEAWSVFYSYAQKSNLFLGQNLSSDMSYLNETYKNKKKYDTLKMFNYYQYNYKHKVKLGTILSSLQIEYKFLHNAGNDAYYTIQAALKMAA